MEIASPTVSQILSVTLLLLSLVTPFVGLTAFDGSVRPVSEAPSDATTHAMDDLSAEDQENTRKVLRCDGDVTVYAWDYHSLPAPFDHRHYSADSTYYGRYIEYQGNTYRFAVSGPGSFGSVMPRGVTVLSVIFFVLSLVSLSHANRAKQKDDRGEAWILSIIGGLSILLLLYIANYQYYLVSPISC